MEEPSTDLQSKVEQLGFDEGVKISVFDENFQLLATTQPQLYEEEKSNFQIEKRLRELSSELDEKGEYFENQEKEKSGNLSYLIRAQKVEGQGYIVVRTSILSIQKNMMLTDTFYILSGILTLAVGSIIIIRFSRKMVKPLEDMNQVTQQIARLNFKEYVRVDSKDELGTLAASINSMSDQLRDAMGELQKELEFRKATIRIAKKEDENYALPDDKPLTKEQKEEIDAFWKKYEFMGKIDYRALQAFYNRSGIFDPRYVPHYITKFYLRPNTAQQ